MQEHPLVAIVDDDPGVTIALDGLLRSLGYRVATFHRPAALLASGVLSDAGCVVSDVRMPGGMDGIELARQVGDRCPVILMSAFLSDAIHHRAKAAGAHCLLEKPLVDEALIDCLDKALS